MVGKRQEGSIELQLPRCIQEPILMTSGTTFQIDSGFLDCMPGNFTLAKMWFSKLHGYIYFSKWNPPAEGYHFKLNFTSSGSNSLWR